MDLLSQLNLEQLGVSGLFIGFLIWLYIQKGKELESEKDERKSWQDKAFTVSRESQKEVSDAITTLDKAIDLLQRGS